MEVALDGDRKSVVFEVLYDFFLLSTLYDKFKSNDIGLYRDDELAFSSDPQDPKQKESAKIS